MMGIDKLRLTTTRLPELRFCSAVNSDLQRHRDQRLFDVRFRYSDESSVQPDSICQITSITRTYPVFFINLNFSAKGRIQPKQILELNPNNLSNGFSDLAKLIEFIFGSDPGDFGISRIDLNADIELPVEYFFRNLRIPLKRKSSKFTEIQHGQIRAYSDRGLNGFYVGRSPALLRVYDKRQDLKRLRKDVSTIPAVFTRLEWELRNRSCPCSQLSEFPEMEHCRPFENVQIIEEPDIYDFHNAPVISRKTFLFNKLNEEYGAQEAIRILNFQRNFKRDYGGILFDNTEIKERLQRSYVIGVEQFLGNSGPERDRLARVLW